MQRYASSLFLAALLSGVAAPAALGQAAAGAAEVMNAVAANSLTWTEAGVPGFAPGMKIAVIQGNPEAAGQYTLRLSFPDGYQFPPHWHPMVENVTVLSGTLQLAMGERADETKLKAYGPGDYLYIPATHPHFGGARGFTVIQLHGQGPFAINLVNKASR
jgi:quercetin dioxygenase-like cupin family protein